MSNTNLTFLKEIVILGFDENLSIRILIFTTLLVGYVVTIVGNCLIIVLVLVSPRLHSPMYFFLCHLAITDMIVPSDVIPNLLYVTLSGRGTLSILGCLTQLFFFGISANTECLLLTVMSYDRYLAICRPLHYKSIMSHKLQVLLTTCCWVVGFSLSLMVTCHILTLSFCGTNTINHFFCDLDPVLDLSCSDTFVIDIEVLVVGILIIFLACVFIVVTYVCIFHAILGSPITTGRKKVFSTCTSHLTVVCTYYGTLFANYLSPVSGRIKYLSLLNTVMTPLLNPVIYSLRNQEIRSVLKTYIPFQ
ncbi:hypothetical protein GDO86_017974 [Hymenochirus boettgeri]|uniref:Olfactory receptor n=1 Tax=Hymenochirus boettgeri TaxID=247094 RepID=A0A8T2INA7_9PIPI|nr:hypothetical protein GDO86_017974 [Hymenochirus boettgeri]